MEDRRSLTLPPVLVVAHYFPPHIGGMEAVVQAQVDSLDRRGHAVTVLTCAHQRGMARAERSGSRQVRRIRAANFLERRFGVTFPIPGAGGALTIIRAVGRAGIVHVHDVFYPTSHVAFLAARLRRRPYFVTQHVALVEHPSRLVMGVQRLVYRSIGGAILRGAERVVVYNARVRDFLVSLGVEPDRVLMNHNGIDTDRFSPPGATVAGTGTVMDTVMDTVIDTVMDTVMDRDGAAGERAGLRARYGLPADRPVALFVGRLVPKKGYDLAAAAGCPAYTTVIVGEGAGAAPVSGPDVVMFGPATGDRLVDLYRLSDVFVFPALGEMFTLVMQEAMATGLPVVTTDDPAYAEYGLDRELISLVPREPAAIRDAVLAITGSPGRAAAMGRYSRRLALERFSWEANYEREYAIYGCPGRAATPSEAGAGTREEVGLVASLAG